MPEIIITNSQYSREVPVSLNGQTIKIPVGRKHTVSAEVERLLHASNAEYEIVGGARSRNAKSAGVGEGPGGAAPTPIVDLNVLDASVPNIIDHLDDFTIEQIEALRAAEQIGKTRKTLMAEFDARLSPEGTES